MPLSTFGSPFSYILCDFKTSTVLAELPFTSVRFASRLNTPGAFSADLILTDPRIQNLNYLTGTQPSRTSVFVDLNGSLVGGYYLQTRNYERSTKKFELQGRELWCYFEQRVQAQDYTTFPASSIGGGTRYWTAQPSDPMLIAAQIVADAINIDGSGLSNMIIQLNGMNLTNYLASGTGPPPSSWINGAYPLSQLQTVDSIITTLSQMGYGVGFDFGIDLTYVAGVPTPVLNFSYPRRGRVWESTLITVDAADAMELTWPEDGTQTNNRVWVTGAMSGGGVASASWPSAITQGYPLLEDVASNPVLTVDSPTATPVTTNATLQAIAEGDLTLTAYPVITPSVTLNGFNDPVIGTYLMGDDCRLIIPDMIGVGAVGDERYPNGFDYIMRIIAADHEVLDEGIVKSTLTYNAVPSTLPVQIPLS